MSTNSRFTVGIHMLTLLALSGEEVVTSEYIAGSVNTNPVVIRRLISQLRDAKWVPSEGGLGGGLAARPVPLRDIHVAMEGSTLFPMHPSPPNPLWPVGGQSKPLSRPPRRT